MAANSSITYQVYAFGSNGSGQLGLGHYEDINVPLRCVTALPQDVDGRIEKSDAHDVDRLIEPLVLTSAVESIVAGGNHTLLLTREGEVFATGKSDDGRCGTVWDRETYPAFHRVQLSPLENLPAVSREVGGVPLHSVTHVAATWEASFFVLNNRTVLICGTGGKGELGLGPMKQSSPDLQHLLDVHQLEGCDGDLEVEILEIVGSMNHVVMLTSNGKVYGWGHSRKGQLGPDHEKAGVVWQPSKLQIPFRATKVLLGRTFTFVLGENSEHLLLGKFNASIDLFGSDSVPFLAYFGWSSMYELSGGHIRGNGRNDRGQLPKHNMPDLTLFAAGSEHCIACTEDGKVIAWGWGEHGNCGEPIDDRGNVNDDYNIITLPALTDIPVYLGAGCATSFVVVATEIQSNRPLT